MELRLYKRASEDAWNLIVYASDLVLEHVGRQVWVDRGSHDVVDDYVYHEVP